MFALIDANNFYVEAEKQFNPGLTGKPIVILSSNDGCVVSRSNEAKAIGIKMGEPFFKIKEMEHTHGLVALSSNYPLYADMSNRLYTLAQGLGPEMEPYSVDEVFIGDLSGIRNLTRRAWTIRDRILTGIGLPCGIGLGPTKTLAKLANHISKSSERKPGSYPAQHMRVCNLLELGRTDIDRLLEATPVTDIWGIGPRIGDQLLEAEIYNALQLKNLNPAIARKCWSLQIEKTVRELRGESCIQMELAPPPKKTIICSKSFGRVVTELPELVEAVCAYATTAAEKLRKQASRAGLLQVFAHSSPFRPGPRFSRSILIPLPGPTADTTLIVAAATLGATKIFEEGYELVKAGIVLMDFYEPTYNQTELDLGTSLKDKSSLLETMDRLNSKYGRGTVQVAAMGVQHIPRVWAMKQERRTPGYTTNFQDILKVNA